MFDWDDEVLANVVWSEAGENEDHIVPYRNETYEKPPGSYGEHSKERDQEAANVKLTEKTTPVCITDSLEGKVGSNTHYDTHGRVAPDGLCSLPDLSPSHARKLDLEHMDEKIQVDNCSETFDHQPKDGDTSDFVDYGWANVGSFDDLDRILSNNDLLYGNVNISNTEALWSSPKDVIGCPEKSDLLSVDSPSLQLEALRSDHEHVETKSHSIKDEKQTNNSHGKMNDHLGHSMLCVDTSLFSGGKNEHARKEKSALEVVGRTPSLVYPIGAVNVAMPDEIAIGKMDWQRKLLRCQKTTGEKIEARRPQTSSGPWFSLGNQGKEFERQYSQHIKSSSKVPFGSSYLSDKTTDARMMPLSMTPQEKIEKLRRRQQMRAMLAIHKQQQQFRHQVSCNDHSTFLRCSHESQLQFARAGNVEIDESLSTLMSLDANAPIEQSDSDTKPMMRDKNTLEDTILHQLETVIATLGMQIRLCIRDSLFRLAQSSLQRQYAGDTSGTNKSSRNQLSVITEERLNSKKGLTRMPDGETETNPIDRAVAHLLFHRPPELSGQLPKSLESPLNAKLPCETTATSTDFPLEFLKEIQEEDQLSCLVSTENELKTSCVDGLENASNNKTANGNVVETEASSQGAALL